MDLSNHISKYGICMSAVFNVHKNMLLHWPCKLQGIMFKLFFGVPLMHFIYILYLSAVDTEMYTYDNKNCFQS